MKEMINWGVLAPGGIARKFAQGIAAVSDARVAAVGSRSLARAQAFASEFHAPKAYGSYEELADDPDVDVIYVASPHSEHYAHVKLCLSHNKPVLCEKAFTVNAGQAAELVAMAREKKLFLMEAMWTRFQPGTAKVRELLREGAVGEVRMLRADFCFRCAWEPRNRLLNLNLAGGALLDAGVYPVSYASMVFGAQPESIGTAAHFGETGVDEQFAAVFGYSGGKIATVSGAVRTKAPVCAYIYGTEGYICVPDFLHPHSVQLVKENSEPVEYLPEITGNGYNYEAAEVGRMLRGGKTESSVMPLDETLAIMRTMDAIRGKWGYRYPFE